MIFTYSIKNTFQLENFITAVYSDGVKIYSTDTNPVTNGFYAFDGIQLTIELYEADKIEKNWERLPGKLDDYKPTIDARVDEFNI